MTLPSPPIRVVVRVRPSDGHNGDDKDEDAVLKMQLGSEVNVPMLCLRSKDGSSYQGYKFDGILDGRASQSDLMTHFDGIIDGLLRGVSCTTFAYGPTSSGKTYSLIGKGFDDAFETKLPWNQVRSDVYSQRDSWGIVPRTIYALFGRLDDDDSSSVVSFNVRCSFMQIYNDKVFDLLASGKSTKSSLPIREDARALGGVTIYGLSSIETNSPEQAIKLLYQGGRRRTVRETSCNERSSRSHAIFRLSVEVCAVDSQGSPVTRRSLLNLVDCAGSERWGTEERSKLSASELTSINTSLSALGNCISALARNQKHIPFRSSALTRILKDCLGGGARAMIIATVHSNPSCRFETASTLAFASRALQLGKILPGVKVDEKVDDSVLLRQAKAEIHRLKAAMEAKIGNHDNDDGEESNGWEGKVRVATAAIHDVVDAVEAGKIRPDEVGGELKSFFSLSRRLQASVEVDVRNGDDEKESIATEGPMQGGEDTSERQETILQNACHDSSVNLPDNSTVPPISDSYSNMTADEPSMSPRSLAEARHEELCSSFDAQVDIATPEPLPKAAAHHPAANCERHNMEDCFLCRKDATITVSERKHTRTRHSTISSPPPSNRTRIRQRNIPSTEPRPRWNHRTDSFSRNHQEPPRKQGKSTRRHTNIPAPSMHSSHSHRSPSSRSTVDTGQRQRLKSPIATQSPPQRKPVSSTVHRSTGAIKKRPTSSRIRMRPEDMKSAKDRARMAIAEASRVLAHM
mmetsp:Transcript_24603/g.70918  ORF Transcript_24603/g.70918 Transcript_24603/m.70918 type:complete len:747 (+) Transcript_24603:757-2997(+)